ncbi:MAG: transcriptional regulator [Actinobacteria bacterium]|nr:MAG: transcriptional regulator [Actinomycetota bacterium]
MDRIERDLKIAAPPEQVFAYLTDPDKLSKWQASSASVDLRVGGEYTMDVASGHIARGSFTEIDPPRKLVYTFGWENHGVVPPGATTIEITLEQDGDYTLLHFVHSGLRTEEEVASHTKGWGHYLPRLEIAASGGDPGPDLMASA